MCRRLQAHAGAWDMIVVGGGATGAGVAIDAASRGYEVLLLEQSDFGKGTSSRSTKLVHGGVRYLEQGNVSLVMEALKERGLLLQNAPHLVRNLGFVVPNYDWWEAPFYGIGLKLYNLLAGKYGFGASRILSREETLERLPTLNTEGLRGGVIYFDGQFDDSRLLINLVATACEQGAALLNYAQVTGLSKDGDGFVNGVTVRDVETGEEFEAPAKVVINATGPFTDDLRRKADPSVQPMIAPSQGIHLVFDGSFLAGDSAIMVPHTSDGRVMFAIPWHGHTLVGTTDTPVAEAALEPVALEQEIDFILQTASLYLAKKPDARRRAQRLRRNPPAGARGRFRQYRGAFARPHHPHRELRHGHHLRRQVDHLSPHGGRLRQPGGHTGAPGGTPCVTDHLNIHGFHSSAARFGRLAVYGSDAPAVLKLAENDPSLSEPLHSTLPYTAAEVVWAAREEMARTVEDVLARRTRALFLNAGAAFEMAPRVAALMARELGRDAAWESGQVQAFHRTARGFLLTARPEPGRACPAPTDPVRPL